MNLKKNILIGAGSMVFAIVLVYVGYEWLISPEHWELLYQKEYYVHILSCLFVIPIYLVGGWENYILLNKVYGKKISLYDVVSIPFVINLWSYIIPFQGSYIYYTIYLKKKYSIPLTNATSVFAVSTSVSFVIAGFIGALFCFLYTFKILFFIISMLFLLNPFIAISLSRILNKINFPEIKYLSTLFFKLKNILNDYKTAIKSISLLGWLFAMNILNSLAFTLWSYWIVNLFEMNISFFQLLVLAFLIKLTLLLKITPGNLGVSQFATSGVIVLVGGLASEGFTLSLYQAAIYILVALFLGGIFSIVNVRFFMKNNNEFSLS